MSISKCILGVFSCLFSANLLAETAKTDWAGPYVGLNAGYAATESESDNRSTAWVDAETERSGGFIGGVQGGYNWQINSLVLGLEADFNAFDTETTSVIEDPIFFPRQGTFEQTVETDWLITLRPRIGFATKPVFMYVTGGLAVTRLKDQAIFSEDFPVTPRDIMQISEAETKFGWTVGAGAELSLNEAWSVKAEYLYVNFAGVSSSGVFEDEAGLTNPVDHSANIRANIVRAGLNYHF